MKKRKKEKLEVKHESKSDFSFKGELLFRSVELIKVIVPNIKCGPQLCYFSKIYHISTQ